MKSVARFLFLVLLVPFLAEAQSLGSVAKKERERREKNKAAGVTVREISEDEIDTDPEEPAEEESAEAAPADADADADATSSESLTVAVSEDKTRNIDAEQADRRRQEAEWRTRMQEARERIDWARERVEQLKGLHLVEGERYVDAQGRTVISSLEHLNRLVAEANAELKTAEQSLQQLQQEARRAGVPPGWLR